MAHAIAITLPKGSTKNSFFSSVIQVLFAAFRTLALPLGLMVGLTNCTTTDTVTPETPAYSSAREAASVFNNDSFDDTKLAAFWRPELMTPTAGLLTREKQRVGNQAMRFSWKPAQADGSNKMLHSELATDPIVNGDTERWYGYSSFMPSAAMANDDQTTIVSQWHGVPDPGFSDSVPPVRIELTSNKLQLVYVASSKPIVTLLQNPTSQKIIDLGPVTYDAWVDYVVHVKWDSNGNTGILQVWQNGKLVINDQKINIGYPQKSKPYWKVGLYCWTGKARAAEKVMYVDEVRMGTANSSYNEVKPGLGNNTAR